MKFLVTGGAGFIGSNLANTLVKARQLEDIVEPAITPRNKDGGVSLVVALDDLSLGSTSNLSKEVKFLEGSVMNYNLIKELTTDCDYIFHQAALSSSPMFKDDPKRGIDVNVMGFMNIMEAARRNKVHKVVYASSSSLYNGLSPPYKESAIVRPKTFYESSFYCREIIARSYNLEYGIDSVGLRYFSVYGPNEKHKGKFANTISQFVWDMAEKKKSPTIYGNGEQTRDFTFVDDVVRANILALNRKKRGQTIGPENANDSRVKQKMPELLRNRKIEGGFSIYNVGTGIQTSFNAIVEIINRKLGTDMKPNYVKNPISHYVQHTMADISLAKEDLGYKPRWDNVEEGIEKLLSPYRRSNWVSKAG